MITEEIQRTGITSILSHLKDREVISLATTVTQGLLKNKVKNRQGKITCTFSSAFF